MIDPNADLIGFSFPIKGKNWTVTGTPTWSEKQYVTIEAEGETKTVRPAGLIRQAMRRTEESS